MNNFIISEKYFLDKFDNKLNKYGIIIFYFTSMCEVKNGTNEQINTCTKDKLC